MLRTLTLVMLCCACSTVYTAPTDDEIGADTDSATTETSETGTGDSATHVCGDTFDLLQCESNFCEGRWSGSSAWSPVLLPGIVDLWPEVSPAGVFLCDPTPPVDGCGKMDDEGHIVCWVNEGECSRIAAPLCAVTDAVETAVWPDWMPCGAGEPIGMTVLCTDSLCWSATDPTSAVTPGCL